MSDAFDLGKSAYRGTRKISRRKKADLEADLNTRIQDSIRTLDPVRVENCVGDGMPDIEYIGGWIESKRLKAWPKRDNTPVRVPHYTPEQRGWHSRRRRAGGRVHVVIQVATAVFVFDAAEAAAGLGHWTRGDMNRRALLAMDPWDSQRFRAFITQCDRDHH